MKVLASCTSAYEARVALDAGADIIDIKNPAEGSLGAQPPWVIAEILEACGDAPVSVALGDLAHQPGTAALAAYGAACFDARYFKAGLRGAGGRTEAIDLLTAIVTAIRSAGRAGVVVAAGYADFARFGGARPTEVIEAAIECRCGMVMLDTAFKDRGSLFDVLSETELLAFVDRGHAHGLGVALAGSLNECHIESLRRLDVDVVGVRGGICKSGGRRNALVPARIRRFMAAAHGATNGRPAPGARAASIVR
jgi:uncharacterized protein (UPF0264 family)